MEKYNLNSFKGALMNSELATMLNIDMHSVCVMNAICFDIIGSTLSILMIVGGNYDDFLAEFGHSYRQLVDHDS